MPRGRHARPSQTKKHLQNAAVIGVAATSTPFLFAGNASAEELPPESVFLLIADCESGSPSTPELTKANVPNSSGASSAEGFFQIIRGTWEAHGGTEFAPTAMGATYEQQLIVAQRIWATRGSFADWNASKSCWGPRMDAAMSAGAPTPAPAPAPVEPEPVEPAAPSSAPEPEATDAPVADGPVTVEEPAEGSFTHTVVSGDTVSLIALERGVCGPDDDIKVCWEDFYQQNRGVIGANPDRIFPGQQLTYVGGLRLPGGAPVPVDAPAETPAAPVEEQATAEAPAVEDAQEIPAVSGAVRPTAGVVTSGYGPRWGKMHDGIDFDGAIGDLVVAADGGTVEKASDTGNGYGLTVSVRHEDGSLSFYAHLDTATVSVGQVVAAGQQVGTVGNSGSVVAGPNGDGSHLHFGVHVGPGGVNPVHWLADRGLSL